MTSTHEDESPGTQTLVVVTPAAEVVVVADKLICWPEPEVASDEEFEAAVAAAVDVEAEAGPLCNK